MLWFGDTRVTNTPVHAADERHVECSWAHEQSGVGGGPVLELFEGEASRESGNVTWESFVHGVEIDICCMVGGIIITRDAYKLVRACTRAPRGCPHVI